MVDDECVSCPENMRTYRGNCLFPLSHCIEYQGGFDCTLCEEGYQVNLHTYKCEEKKDYKDQLINIASPELEGDRGTAFLIGNDLLKSLHPKIAET